MNKKSKLSLALFLSHRPQYEIALAASMSETRLSRISLGRLVPSADERRRIALALGQPEGELFDDPEECGSKA